MITIDIETLPTAEPFESKLFWTTEEQYRKTACDANLGRILCIGYAEQNERGAVVERGCFGWREEARDFETDEEIVLAGFWQLLRGFDVSRDLIVGHNIMDFDLPFIVRRSIIKNVRPTVKFYFGKYRKAPIFDTMRVWDCLKWGRSTSLRKLAFALGLEGPKTEDIDGSKIYDAFLEGRFEEIYRYCRRDVETTRRAWNTMNCEPPAQKRQAMELAL